MSDEHEEGFLTAFLAVIGAVVLFGLFIWAEWNNGKWNTVAFNHFAATVGVPAAAAGALVVVALFRTAEGRIKFEVIGFKFEGASGPIIMWVLCFLAITAAIKTL